MPALVFPNEDKARDEVYHEVLPKNPELVGKVYFCLDWKPMWNNKAQCANACALGSLNNNLCMRCPAGYMLMNMAEKDFERGRIGISLRGW